MSFPPGVPVTHRACEVPEGSWGFSGDEVGCSAPLHHHPPGQGGDSGECTSHYHTQSPLLVSLGTRSLRRGLLEPGAKGKKDVAQRSSDPERLCACPRWQSHRRDFGEHRSPRERSALGSLSPPSVPALPTERAGPQEHQASHGNLTPRNVGLVGL